MEQLLTVDNVDVCFGSRLVLKGISFEVRPGEMVGVIGRNASGKTTLLRVMGGIVKPNAGIVYIEGRNVVEFPRRELARVVAVVPQDGLVAFDFTVLELVMMGRTPHLGRMKMESGRDVGIALEAMERAQIGHLSARKVSELSGGECQRVMIARALTQEARILLLDEPTAHLDINYQVEILHLVRQENLERSSTVIVVLHDLNLAAEFCDRLIMLSDGCILADGPPEEVITRENVQRAYGAAVWVRRHPTSGRPYVLSLGSQAIAGQLLREGSGVERFRVHVICGGGSGGRVFAALLESGCYVTAGVINIGDTDQESAESLGIEYVEDAPFSPISEEAQSANLGFIQEADVVIVAEVPFGPGNIANLYAAAEALALGKRVVVMGESAGFRGRDFTGGEALKTIEAMVRQGAIVLETVDGISAWIAEERKGLV